MPGTYDTDDLIMELEEELEKARDDLSAEIIAHRSGKKREDAMHERWKKATAKYPNGAEGCCCLFDKDGNQINWCSVHAELRDERDALKAELDKRKNPRCHDVDEFYREDKALRGGEGWV